MPVAVEWDDVASTGSMIGGRVGRAYSALGLPDGTVACATPNRGRAAAFPGNVIGLATSDAVWFYDTTTCAGLGGVRVAPDGTIAASWLPNLD